MGRGRGRVDGEKNKEMSFRRGKGVRNYGRSSTEKKETEKDAGLRKGGMT